MRNALRAAFISPESNDNLTRTIAALPESILKQPWMTFGLLKSCNKISKLYIKYLKKTVPLIIKQNISNIGINLKQ